MASSDGHGVLSPIGRACPPAAIVPQWSGFGLTLRRVAVSPITPDDHGTPLPPDGGAPGKAYLGYHAALVKRDAKALKPFVSNEMREYLTRAEKKGKLAAELKFMAREHPDKSVQITKGFSRGNNAVLLIAGETSVMKLTGEVVLVNEDGTWRVDDQLTDVVMQ